MIDRRFSIGLVVGVVMLTGCADEPRSVGVFMGDDLARENMLLQCQSDPGAMRLNQECRNARIATERLARIREDAEKEAERATLRARRDRELHQRERAAVLAENRRDQAFMSGASLDTPVSASAQPLRAADADAGTLTAAPGFSVDSQQPVQFNPEPAAPVEAVYAAPANEVPDRAGSTASVGDAGMAPAPVTASAPEPTSAAPGAVPAEPIAEGWAQDVDAAIEQLAAEPEPPALDELLPTTDVPQ